jgi:hypothetical protein
MHLLEDHPDLDSFSEADLVGEERLAVHLEECAMGGIDLVFKELDVLLVEVGKRTEFGIGLTSLESVGLYGKKVVVYPRGLVNSVDQIIGVLVTDLDVNEVVGTHLLFPGRPLP